MKKVLLVLALFASNVALADVQPEDIFGGILDIIQDQINKDKNKVDYGPGVILKDIGNNRIALGRIRLTESDSMDSFTLPKCNQSPNVPVSALRFQVSGSDAYVRRVRITYQNGDMENVNVDEVYDSGTPSDWFQVDTGKRCVQSITVRGGPVTIVDDFGFDNGGFDNGGFNGGFELGPIKGFKKGPQFPPSGHPGWGGPQPVPHFPPGGGPGWNPGPQHPGWGGPNPGPGWGGPKPPPMKPAPTVLTFIGLKADNNGF